MTVALQLVADFSPSKTFSLLLMGPVSNHV